MRALRSDSPLEDAKLEALAQFTRVLWENHGKAGKQELQTFLDAGYNRKQAPEVILGLTAKTASNFVNNLADTPLNDELKDFAWKKTTKTRKRHNS